LLNGCSVSSLEDEQIEQDNQALHFIAKPEKGVFTGVFGDSMFVDG